MLGITAQQMHQWGEHMIHSPKGVSAMLHAMTLGALLTRSRLCTVSWGAIRASSASPQPKSATTALWLCLPR